MTPEPTEFARWCHERGMSITEAARLIGVSFQSAWRWYHGRKKPSAMAARLIALAEKRRRPLQSLPPRNYPE